MSSSSGDGGGGDPKLPQDVVVEILKRLPVKSLLRFRCVSQSWRSAIDDPAFVVLHSNHSSLDSSNWYLMCLNYRHDLQDTCSLFAHDSLTLPSQLRVETPFVTPPRRFYFVGWCNGLICVADFSRNGDGPRMYLWNFFTRKHKAVRLSYRPEEPQFLSKEASSEFVGFGFDAGSNDYKIVTILHFRVDRRWFSRVGIYSLRTDSWRSLECEVPAFHGERQRAFMDGYLQWDNQRVFLNGNLHWVATKLDDMVLSKDASLFVFNVAGEVFEEMALPENKSASSLLSVAVLSDLLTVFFRAYDFRGNNYCYSVCTIWVMRDYGVPQSWTKLHTFEIDQRVVGFYGWTCNGELLMEIDCFGDKKRISLNLITGEVTVLPLSGTIDLVMLVENLISLEI